MERRAYRKSGFCPPNSYREFTEDVKLADGKPTHYGLGVQVGDFHGTPQIMHSGEVSGFLAMNRVYPAKGIAVTVLSNEDGVNLIGPLSEQLALMMLAARAVRRK